MENIIKDIEALSVKIKNSDVYNNYLDIKQIIETDINLKNELDVFKKVQTDYEIKRIQNVNIEFSEEQYISKLYSDLMLNENAKRFLLAEEALLELIKNVNNIIINSFEPDINIPF